MSTRQYHSLYSASYKTAIDLDTVDIALHRKGKTLSEGICEYSNNIDNWAIRNLLKG